MAVSTITYTNKVAINENASVADINKIKADDMNEIKSVVNNNAGETSTNTTDIQNIKEGQVYSTSEIKTNKTWIDGKKIYRKTFTLSSMPSSNTNLVDISGLSIDTVTELKGIIKTNENWDLPVPMYDSSSNYSVLFKNETYIRGRAVLGSGTVTTVNITLEYTKTTD